MRKGAWLIEHDKRYGVSGCLFSLCLDPLSQALPPFAFMDKEVNDGLEFNIRYTFQKSIFRTNRYPPK